MNEKLPSIRCATAPAADQLSLDVLVSEAIAKLPRALRGPLILRTIEGMSQAETAQLLGVSEKSVETRLYRARNKFTELLRA